MKRRVSVGICLLIIGPVLLILFGCSAEAVDEDPLALPTAGNVGDITVTPTPFSFSPGSEAEPGVETVTEMPPGAKATPGINESPVAPAQDDKVTYTVQGGDTLLGIAMAHDVPMAAIQIENDLGTSTVVKVGQTLEIPAAEGWLGASPFWVLYEVSEGETLSEIGKAYDVEVATLTSVNALSAADAIRVGDFLILPVDGPAVARLPEPTATPIRLPTPTATPEPIVEAAAEPTSAPATEVAPPVPAAPPPADIADWPYELVRLINEFRAEHGLPPYIYNETLARAAQAHANDCVQRGSCSHTGSDGSSVKERIVRAGYVGTGYAECWAQRQSPQGALDIWLDEIYPQEDGTVEFGPHRRMMLHTWFTEIGVGVAETDWGYYFIADFGRP